MDGELVRFVDELPPGSPTTEERWDAVIAELRTQPGRWAEVAGAPRSLTPPFVWLMNYLHAAGCETARRSFESHHVLYARWPEGV